MFPHGAAVAKNDVNDLLATRGVRRAAGTFGRAAYVLPLMVANEHFCGR